MCRAVIQRALTVIIFIFLGLVPLYAGGQGETRLQEIDRLIVEKEYVKAFSLLNQVMTDNPDMWDRAQERMDLLLGILDRKNVLETEMLQAIEEENVDLAIQKLEELQEVDPEPNVQSSELRAEFVLTLNIIRDDTSIDELMDRARVALDNDDPDEALSIYLSGFDIGKEIFESTEYGNTLGNVVEAVYGHIEEMKSSVVDFSNARPVYEELLTEYRDAVDRVTDRSDVSDLHESILDLVPVVLGLDADESNILGRNDELHTYRVVLSEALDEVEDIYYLRYADALVNGRPDESGEGIIVALDVGLAEQADAIGVEVAGLLESAYESGVEAYEADNYSLAAQYFGGIAARKNLLYDVAPLASYRVRPGEGFALGDDELELAADTLSGFAGAEARYDSANRYLATLSSIADIRELADPVDGVSREELESSRTTLRNAIALATDEAAASRLASEPYATSLANYVTEDEKALFTPIVDDLEFEAQRLRDIETRVVGRIVDTRVAAVRDAYTPAQPQNLDSAKELIAGEDTGPGEGYTQGVQIHKSPTRAEGILEETGVTLAGLESNLEEIVESYDEEPAYILESEPVIASLEAADGLRNQILSTSDDVAQTLVQAKNLIDESLRLEADTLNAIAVGERLIEENENLLDDDDYSEAVGEIIPAVLEVAAESLTFEWDQQFRDDIEEWAETYDEAAKVARLSLLQKIARDRYTEAESYLASVADDMQADEFEEANSRVVPVRSALSDSQAFRDDPAFESELNGDIEELEGAIRVARAEELRRDTDDMLADARDFYDTVAEDMQADDREAALEVIEPVRDAFNIAETFLSDTEFAGRINGEIASLENDIRDARADTLRRETDTAIATAEEYLEENSGEMTAIRYETALDNLDPAAAALAEAEAFLPNTTFRNESNDRIENVRSGAEDSRAALLRLQTRSVLADARSHLSDVLDDTTADAYASIPDYTDPVEIALEAAETFQSSPSFRAEIESAVATVKQQAEDARAIVLRGETEAYLVDAEAFLESNRIGMSQEAYETVPSLTGPTETALEIAESFQSNPTFRSDAESRIAAVEQGALDARATVLRDETDDLMVEAESFLAANEEEMPRDLFDVLPSLVEPVEAALAVADSFQRNTTFTFDIESRIEDVENGFSDAHSAYLKRQTRDRLAEAEVRFENTQVNMSEEEYNDALNSLVPVADALADAQSFRRDLEFNAEIDDAVALLTSNIKEARADIIREEAINILDFATENANAGVAAADENAVLVAAEKFTAARDYLQEATALAGEANEIVFDDNFTAIVDSRRETLQDRILEAEIAIIVREVRERITDATDAYEVGDYDIAYTYILEAEKRWGDASVEANTEIVYWTNIINVARQALSGREVDESDPRYEMVRQWLNHAQYAFDEGRKLWERGDEAGANEMFEESITDMGRVRTLFPLNREVGLLNLNISKLTKTDAEFKEDLEEQIAAARRDLRSSNVTTRLEAYATLTDIREISPGFKDLDDIILEAEYDLDIKERPIDPARLREAQSNYAQALELYNRFRVEGVDAVVREAQFKQALAFLDEALEINPRYSAASALKDEVSTSVGGDVIASLSTEDQRKFELAQELYIEQDNPNLAFIYVSELWAVEENRGYKKLADLFNVLKAALDD